MTVWPERHITVYMPPSNRGTVCTCRSHTPPYAHAGLWITCWTGCCVLDFWLCDGNNTAGIPTFVFFVSQHVAASSTRKPKSSTYRGGRKWHGAHGTGQSTRQRQRATARQRGRARTNLQLRQRHGTEPTRNATRHGTARRGMRMHVHDRATQRKTRRARPSRHLPQSTATAHAAPAHVVPLEQLRARTTAPMPCAKSRAGTAAGSRLRSRRWSCG